MAKGKSGIDWAWALRSLGIIALVGFALWFTHSLWAFLGLFFLFFMRPMSIKAQCPKCNHEFVATEKEDYEEYEEEDEEDEKEGN